MIRFIGSAFVLLGISAFLSAQIPGGFSDQPVKNSEVKAAADFAVSEQAKKEKTVLKLAEIVKASSQVVAGTNYRLSLKVENEGKVREAEATVWRKLDQSLNLTNWKWK